MPSPVALDARSSRPQTVWEYRALIWNFTSREMKARFKGTAIGWAWSFVGPLATILIYSLVFSVIIRIQPPPFGNGNPGNYAVWLICGLVTWNFISGTILQGMPTLLSNGDLLRKVYFPSFVPVVSMGLAVGIQSLIELGVVMLILVAFLNVSWTWLLVPFWVACVVIFTVSVSYVLAVANVRWRDLAQIMNVLVQIVFFLSPIIYPISLVPEYAGPIPVRLLVQLNPISHYIEVGRELLYELVVPSPLEWGVLVLLSGLSALLAAWVFRRWGQDVGEAL